MKILIKNINLLVYLNFDENNSKFLKQKPIAIKYDEHEKIKILNIN